MQKTLYENMINGKSFLRLTLDTSALCKMNIKTFDDAIKISNEIRMLFNIEKLLFNRSISLPDRYPITHYKLQKIQTGPKYELIKPIELYREMMIIRMQDKHLNHWEKLTEWLKHNLYQQKFLIGRQQKTKIVESTKNVVPMKIVNKNVEKCSKPNCILPCEKNWTNDMYKLPWKLKCLIKREIIVDEMTVDC